MEVVKGLLSSRRFWLAVVTLVVTAAGVAFPGIPPSFIQAFQVFALALIAVFTIDDTVATITAKKK